MSSATYRKGETLIETEKEKDVRLSNIKHAKQICDLVRSSLGPRGMDKMIVDENKDVLISNDGATIMKNLQITHPAAQMLIDISKAQDSEAGDGTTSVVVLAGALLEAALVLLEKGIHANQISQSFQKCLAESVKILNEIALPVDLTDQSVLMKNAVTSLQSKIVSQYADVLAPIAVRAVNSIVDPALVDNVDLTNIRVVKKIGATVADTHFIDGLIFANTLTDSKGVVAAHAMRGGPSRIENAKIGLIQFCLSPPKTDMDQSVIVADEEAMDRAFRQERDYIRSLIKRIKKTKCNVLLIQKSTLRDPVSDLALHYLRKAKIMVIRDIDRREMEFISKATGALPTADISYFTPEKLGTAELVVQKPIEGGSIIEITGCHHPRVSGHTCSILCRGSNELMLDEAERSLHDALCVMRALIKKPFLLPGGGVPETECALRLYKKSKEVTGVLSHCMRAYSDALEIIPTTLAENSGLDAIKVVTELRAAHNEGITYAGINCDSGEIVDMRSLDILQPLLVNTSALTLATELVNAILKIDDIVAVI
ncbi:hypothetical protein PCE1_004444 [Barthelona sp. PCE]